MIIHVYEEEKETPKIVMIVHIFGEEKKILEVSYDSPYFLRCEINS